MDRSRSSDGRITGTVECSGVPHQCSKKSEGWEDDRDLNDLFEHSMPRLFRVADCVLRNHHDSEDALQDSLLSALCHIDQFKGNSQFSTWLYSIVRNAALAKLRRQKGRTMVPINDEVVDEDDYHELGEAIMDPGPDPERACAQSELSQAFGRVLRELPENYRVIIRLCDFEGFSGKEAAHRLGLTVSALKAQHHRARLAIRDSMDERTVRSSF